MIFTILSIKTAAMKKIEKKNCKRGYYRVSINEEIQEILAFCLISMVTKVESKIMSGKFWNFQLKLSQFYIYLKSELSRIF